MHAEFSSLLFADAAERGSADCQQDQDFVSDLHLDQIIDAIAGSREDRDLRI